ncbi:MAG: carboxypeptidase-like regulatory domain-containing protein [Flavobacteriaceae bacterium]|nr:carboxypeptidase-like regulatory domain-containing protein [Flavobacteriaceae bacterium]
MSKYMPFMLFLMLGQLAISQSISGVVLDENNQPLLGASVYFNGTTIGSITDADGKFSLPIEGLIEPELIVSFLGYTSVSVPNPGTEPLQIKLSLETNTIDEVVLVTDGFSREEKLKVFKAMFLGQGEAAAQCAIINERDIRFNYDLEHNTLYAKSDKTLIIQNRYLGYDVLFDLMQFEVNFKQKSISEDEVSSFLFFGTSFFKDQPNYNKRCAKNRIMAYQGSTREFFKFLAEGRLRESRPESANYRVYIANDSLKQPYQNIHIAEHNDYYDAFILPSNNFIVQSEKNTYHYSIDLRVWYTDKYSLLKIQTSKFSIDQYGNTSLLNKLTLFGDMSKRRVALLLPKNYLPNEQ